MKTIMMFILCMSFVFSSSGQKLIKTKMLRDVEVSPPVFTGEKLAIVEASASASIYDYLEANVKYPKVSENKWREGTVIIQFTVKSDGHLDHFQVINSVSSKIDNEVINVLKSSDGMWKPGFNNGTPVSMEKEVGLVFKMENSDHLKMARKLYIRADKKLTNNKHKRALQLLSKALVYQPYSQAILFKRGITKLAIGNKNGACEDWNRLKDIGSNMGDEYIKKHCELEELTFSSK